MATCELFIIFDKEDRRYCVNEPVSGKVVVKVNKDFSGRDMELNYGWRTHGWGNQDQGGNGLISQRIEGLAFRHGEIKEFPFRFSVPCEPLTYHGHYVNVDWYLKASLNVQGILHLAAHTEQDFILLDRNMPVDRLPAPLPEQAKKKIKIENLLMKLLGGGFILLLIFLMERIIESPLLQINLMLGIVTVLIFAIVARRKITNFLLQRIIDVQEAQVNPLSITPNGYVSCCVQFQAKTAIYLDHIAAMIRAEECSTKDQGTRSFTNTYTLFSKETLKSYGEELTAGRTITFNCSVPIPANAPLTFNARNNSINWFIDLKIKCKHWPSWEKNLPITVARQPA